MSRVIKFRAWIESSEVMITDPYNLTFGETIVHLLDRECQARFAVHPDFVMQFTGLQDKNGVDIYEGDIVNVFYLNNGFNHDQIMRVNCSPEYGTRLSFIKLMWESYGHNQFPLIRDLSFGFMGGLSVCDKKITIYHHEYCTKESFFVEVIGNIHENPDLLEVSK